MPASASELFIVDNSDSEWKVRNYLTEWCDLSKTIRLMQEIDEVIEQHGGWPGAFQSSPAS
jgi:hypothetical protein